MRVFLFLVPLHQNPMEEKGPGDTGSRTVMGVAAVNGLTFRKLDVSDRDIKGSLSGFEEAAALLEPVMKVAKEKDLPPHNEKEGGKLAEKFSVFKVRVDPEQDEDLEESEEEKKQEDEADFDVSDDDIETNDPKEEEEEAPEEPPEPEWPDLENGPLRGEGPFKVEPCMGKGQVRVCNGMAGEEAAERHASGWTGLLLQFCSGTRGLLNNHPSGRRCRRRSPGDHLLRNECCDQGPRRGD